MRLSPFSNPGVRSMNGHAKGDAAHCSKKSCVPFCIPRFVVCAAAVSATAGFLVDTNIIAKRLFVSTTNKRVLTNFCQPLLFVHAGTKVREETSRTAGYGQDPATSVPLPGRRVDSVRASSGNRRSQRGDLASACCRESRTARDSEVAEGGGFEPSRLHGSTGGFKGRCASEDADLPPSTSTYSRGAHPGCRAAFAATVDIWDHHAVV